MGIRTLQGTTQERAWDKFFSKAELVHLLAWGIGHDAALDCISGSGCTCPSCHSLTIKLVEHKLELK